MTDAPETDASFLAPVSGACVISKSKETKMSFFMTAHIQQHYARGETQ